MSARRVSSLPALSPSTLWRAPSRPQAFPFGDERTRFFYLGRGAVWHAVRLLGLAGREVLMPAYHHGVEVEALCDAGAEPVFYNVRRDFTLDLESLKARIGRRTGAIYVIHYAGFPQPMADVMKIARENGLRVIEDCALALFSSDGDRALGASGDAGVFCLYKSLPVPNGGALWMPTGWDGADLTPATTITGLHQVASSMLARLERATRPGALVRRAVQATARAVRTMRPLPVDAHPVGHRTFRQGQQHLDISPVSLRVAGTLNASEIVSVRRRNYLALELMLRNLLPPVRSGLEQGVCPLFYPAWCEDKKRAHAALVKEGIEAIDFWSEGSPLVEPGAFPDVEALRAHVLELPIHQDLDDDDLHRMALAVRRALRAA